MFPYWLLFGFAALGSLLHHPQAVRRARIGLVVMAVAVCLMVGLRLEVGADWQNYFYIYRDAGRGSLSRAVALGDPLYQAINWYGQRLDVRIWFVNLICAAAFSWGLYRFSKQFENPWATFAIAVPYLVIVVAMGYTRQGAAMGFVLAALADYIKRENIWRFAALIFAGALFHSSAVIVFPLVALTGKRTRLVNLMVVAVAVYLSYRAFAGSAIEKVREVYLDRAYASQGALVRVAMDVVAGVVFLLFGSRLKFTPIERSIWRNFAFGSLIAAAALAVVSSSAVVDRLALYLLPLQLAVFTRASELHERRLSSLVTVLLLFAAVQFTWLNFAATSWLWTPYRMFWVSE